MRAIRKLNGNDVNLILQMNQDFREEFAVEEKAKAFFTDEENFFYACMEDNRIIGFVYGYILKKLNNNPMAFIHEVGVHRNYRNQGIGTQILTLVKNELFNQGIVKFFLITQSHNVAACKLYEKVGGVVLGDAEHGPCDVSYIFRPN